MEDNRMTRLLTTFAAALIMVPALAMADLGATQPTPHTAAAATETAKATGSTHTPPAKAATPTPPAQAAAPPALTQDEAHVLLQLLKNTTLAGV
jgi:hypothetical protein